MSAQVIELREVGPRDGLQNENPISIDQRIELVNGLLDAGVSNIELGSFVNPTVIPAMADTAEIFAAIPKRDRLTRWALVPNVRGAEMALEAGADALSITASASETYGKKNTGRSVREGIVECSRIRDAAPEIDIDAVVSCSFGSPWEGDFEPTSVANVAKELLDSGATKITLADTTGMGTPRRVMALVNELGGEIGFHFHDTRGTALVNAVAAMSAGVRRFDTSVGAIGGSPFAVDAGGNLGTEDFVHLLDDFGIETGIDLRKLLIVSGTLAELLGHDVYSKVSLRGPRDSRID